MYWWNSRLTPFFVKEINHLSKKFVKWCPNLKDTIILGASESFLSPLKFIQKRANVYNAYRFTAPLWCTSYETVFCYSKICYYPVLVRFSDWSAYYFRMYYIIDLFVYLPTWKIRWEGLPAYQPILFSLKIAAAQSLHIWQLLRLLANKNSNPWNVRHVFNVLAVKVLNYNCCLVNFTLLLFLSP